MKRKHKKHVHSTLYYAPRILAMLVGLFFLLMLFDLPYNFTFCQFVKALLPGLIIILAIILTWNKPRRASLVFGILTVIYTIIGFVYIQENVIGTITVPLIIVSALLIINAKSHMFL
ncbi:hypothetical protein KY348_06970 [Candidatus Woesearchaeota archaeon]|nr:hypothetical protein [Candidatus Woesearchaeota archaeon]